MSKNKELWNYSDNTKVWVGKYLNSQNISHWHNDCELVYINSGKLNVMVDGILYTLNKDEALFIESKKIHNMHAQEDNTIVSIIIFSNELIRNIFSSSELEKPCLTGNYKIEKIYNTLLKELTEKPLFYEQNTNLIIQSLLVKIARNEKLIKRKRNKKIDENLMLLLNKINEDYQYLTFNDAVKIMNMSDAYFSRFFKNIVGISFAKYLNCVKIEKAVELLHTENNYQMTEIADLCGFQTIRNFNRIFKEFTGFTPSKIPNNYIFNGLKETFSNNIKNPTLNSCILIEYSSPHI
jgi:AraC-like DNA-binding protein